jgi:hypothetical protein
MSLALANGNHVDRDGTVDRTELRRVAYKVRDLRAQISFLLGMQAMLGQEPPIHRRPRRQCVGRIARDAARSLPPLHFQGPVRQNAPDETCLPPCAALTASTGPISIRCRPREASDGRPRAGREVPAWVSSWFVQVHTLIRRWPAQI